MFLSTFKTSNSCCPYLKNNQLLLTQPSNILVIENLARIMECCLNQANYLQAVQKMADVLVLGRYLHRVRYQDYWTLSFVYQDLLKLSFADHLQKEHLDFVQQLLVLKKI
jgi:hypothetical protein